MVEYEVRVRSWVRATETEIRTGMLGFLSVEYGDLILDGIVLRKTAEGRYALSFPARTDRAGRRHSFIRPVDDGARKEIERQVLGQLGQREDLGVAAGDRP